MSRASRSLPLVLVLAAAATTALLVGLCTAGGTVAASTAAASPTAAETFTPAPASSTDLIENADAYDGRTVVFEGEAIGDRLERGDHVWVNVSDGANAVGVWAPASMLPPSLVLGRYGVVGDRLRIVAVFHRACAEHGGDFDLHALSAEVVSAGRATPPPVPWTLLVAGPGTFLLVVTGAVRFRKRIRLLFTKS